MLSPADITDRLNKLGESKNSPDGYTAAGVLLILFERDGEYWIILNKRTQKVEHHKGEICFPGGRRDILDKDLTETALRETWEEMGVGASSINVLGVLENTRTTTGYEITPTVAWVSHPYQYDIENDEVEAIIEIPLSILFNQSARRDEAKIVAGQVVNQPAYQYGGNVVFGATARILNNFASVIGERN
tara:strand:- start:3495 stop:4061 length:567 start_codon:yes stop_codon:yes gene_type:complete